MAGGGRGGPVVFPHPDEDDAGRVLDDVGSKNANDDDNDDTPPPPPRKQQRRPAGGGGAGRRRCRTTNVFVPDNLDSRFRGGIEDETESYGQVLINGIQTQNGGKGAYAASST